METLRREIHPVTRVVDSERGIVDYVASTEALDAYQEIIRADGWRFTHFRQNAPFVDSHDYSTVEKVLGKVIDFRVADGKLIERVQWAIDVPDNKLAKLGWQMTRAGYLKAVSVGFHPIKTLSRFGSDYAEYLKQLEELGYEESDNVKTIYLEQEQMELSAVVLGAKPEALARAANEGIISRADAEFVIGKSRSGAARVSVNVPFPEMENTMARKAREYMQEKLLTAFDNLTPKTKGAFERLTNAKNHGGTDGELHAALRAVLREMRHEERLAFGDPVRRIVLDEELNWEINAIVRRACLSRAGMPERYRAITEDATPGSTYVSAKLGAALYDLLALYGGWTTLGVQTMGSKTVNFPYLTARPKAIFVLTQGTQLTPDTNVAGSALSGDAVTIASMLAVSQEWMQDRDRDLCAVFLQSFEQAVNERLDTAFFNGSGVADEDNGGMTGIWQHADPTISTAASGNTTIETLDFEDLVNVLIATPAGVLQRGPIWWANPTSLARLMKVKDAAGRSVVQTPIEQPGRGIASILGYPVTPVAAAPSTNTAGSKVLAFGDGNAYAVGIRKEFALVGSEHCRFDYYSHVVLALSRVHGQMIRPAGFTLLALAAA